MSASNGDVKSELYLKYRPQTLEEVIGQPEAVKIIKGFGKKIPHALLFYGPSGTGKTTIARIVARMLGCPPEHKLDYREIDCARLESAIETIRDIHSGSSAKGVTGDNLVHIFDEVQSLSRAKFAQEAALKMLEDGPDHAYYFLCTTDPKKIILTIRNRCTAIQLKAVPDSLISKLVVDVANKEGRTIPSAVADRIAEVAAGSPRSALVNLEMVLGLDNEKDQLAAVKSVGDNPEAFELVKALLPWKGSPEWSSVAKILETLKEEEPEGLRMMILASARSQLIKTGNPLAYKAIKCLIDPLYDRVSGHALLAAGCFQIVNGKG